MKQILIFAGTTEGRQLIERLCQYHVQIHACVATEYGKEVLPQNKQITIHAQRMDGTQIESFYLHMHLTVSLMPPTLMRWTSHRIFNLPVQINLFPIYACSEKTVNMKIACLYPIHRNAFPT